MKSCSPLKISLCRIAGLFAAGILLCASCMSPDSREHDKPDVPQITLEDVYGVWSTRYGNTQRYLSVSKDEIVYFDLLNRGIRMKVTGIQPVALADSHGHKSAMDTYGKRSYEADWQLSGWRFEVFVTEASTATDIATLKEGTTHTIDFFKHRKRESIEIRSNQYKKGWYDIYYSAGTEQIEKEVPLVFVKDEDCARVSLRFPGQTSNFRISSVQLDDGTPVYMKEYWFVEFPAGRHTLYYSLRLEKSIDNTTATGRERINFDYAWPYNTTRDFVGGREYSFVNLEALEAGILTP